MDLPRVTERGKLIPGNITTSRMATTGTVVGRESVNLLISSIKSPFLTAETISFPLIVISVANSIKISNYFIIVLIINIFSPKRHAKPPGWCPRGK